LIEFFRRQKSFINISDQPNGGEIMRVECH